MQNSTNTFTYGKGDIVSVDFDPSESTITFCKKGSSNEFKYSYKKKENDKLRFCVLFYYVNDEI